MKAIIKFSFLFLFLSTSVYAQLVRPGVTLHRNWSTSAEQSILGSDAATFSNLFVLCGYTTNPVAPYNKSGFLSIYNMITEDTIICNPYASLNTNYFYSVAISDGNAMSSTPVICAGYEEVTPGDKDILIHYTEVNGQTQPTKSMTDTIIPLSYNQEAKFIKQVNPYSYNFWSCGYSESSPGNKDFWLAKIYAYGNVSIQWDTIFGGSGDDVFNSLAYWGSNTVVLSGYSSSDLAIGKDFNFITLDMFNDTIKADSTFHIFGDQVLNSSFKTPNETIVAVGYSDITGSNKDMFIVEYDPSTGDTLWTRTIGTPFNDEALTVRLANFNTTFCYVVAGYTITQNGDKDNYVVIIDQNGNVVSQRIFGEQAIDDCINTMFSMPDNCQYYLFGQQNTSQSLYRIVAFDYNIEVTNVTCDEYNNGIITFVGGANGYGSPTLYDDSMHLAGSAGPSYDFLSPGKYYLEIYYNFPGAKDGGCYIIDSAQITQPDTLFATLISTDLDCMGNPGQIVIVPTGGNPPYTTDWNIQQGGDTLIALTPGEYCVTLSDSKECSSSFCTTLFFHYLAKISGSTNTATGYIAENHGKAILYKIGATGSAAELDSITSYPIDANNLYNFYAEPGDYKVMIQIDSTSYYPNYLDSYYSLNDSVISWQMGDTISVSCDDTIVADVNMYLMTPMTSGIGSISGYIYLFTYTKAVGEPVPGAEILIEQEPNDVPVQCVYTGEDGYYEANGLESGSLYSMQVQIPGYPMINTYMNLPITGTDTLYEEMNFYVDTTLDGGILADTLQTHVYNFTNEKFDLNAYPNPFNSNISFDFNLPNEAFIRAEILNLSGEPVENLLNEKHNKGNTVVYWQPKSELTSGIYFLRVRVDNQVLIKKIIYTK